MAAGASGGTKRQVGMGIAFVGLCAFAVAHWVALLEPFEPERIIYLTAIALATGLALASTMRVRSRAVGRAARIALVLAGVGLALVAMGLPARLLWPRQWDDLGSGISDGIIAAGNVRPWPYPGDDRWLRLTVLMGAAPIAVLAAVAAFWPLRRGETAVRGAGAALLVALFAVATAAAEYGGGVLRGTALFGLIAAWLWLPRLRGRDAVAAVAALVVVAAVAALATPKVAADQPLLDYRTWNWSGDTATVQFDWQHKYGPLDWPRRGTTLLAVKAPEAHYWKAQALDHFDGIRWLQAPSRNSRPVNEDALQRDRRGWTERIRVSVRRLASEVVVGAGVILAVEGDAEPAITLADGTYRLGDPLGPGDTYTVEAYVPDPSRAQMRRSNRGEYEDWLRPFARVGIQGLGAGETVVEFPLRRTDPRFYPDPELAVAGTPYERVYDLARELAAGQSTAYDIVKATERYLERRHEYVENVPRRRDPIPAFLFEDRRGYCQQFSGAMALLLRMNGIPARVAVGFTPGTLDEETGEYRVRDYDAHSWVEVWFPDIGWVPFDPTPGAAPARAQGDSAAASAARGGPADRVFRRDIFARSGGGAGADEGGGPPWLLIASAFAALLAAAAFWVVWLRWRTGESPLGSDIDYLLGLSQQLGYTVPPGTTLLRIEERFGRVGGPLAAAYARRVRQRRYGARPSGGPGPADRRDLRIALLDAVSAGPLTRLRVAVWSVFSAPLSRKLGPRR